MTEDQNSDSGSTPTTPSTPKVEKTPTPVDFNVHKQPGQDPTVLAAPTDSEL